MDLLVGCFEGFVYLLPGKGEGEFDAPERVKDAAGKDVHLGQFWNYEKKKWDEDEEGGKGKDLGEPKAGQPSSSLRVSAGDFNGDENIDLLVGAHDESRKPAIWVYVRE